MMYMRTGLIGGTAGDLDGIDGNVIFENDAAVVVAGDGASPESTVVYFYTLTLNGTAESSPDVIVPDANPGSKCWERIAPYTP